MRAVAGIFASPPLMATTSNADCIAYSLLRGHVCADSRKRHSVADRCGMRRLGVGNLDVGESGADGFEQSGEVVAERLCTYCNCKGNKHDQHGVFGSGGAALVTTQATGQAVHFQLPPVRADPVASARQRRSQSPRSR